MNIMSKANILIIVLIIGILLFGWALFNINVINSFQKLSTSSVTPTPSQSITSPNQTIKPPISLDNNNFNEVAIGYEFIGRITSVKRSPDYVDITISPTIPGMPDYFRVYKENRVIYLKGRDEVRLASAFDLDINQNVRIAAGYVLKTKYYKLGDWNVMYVQIMVPELPTPTPITAPAPTTP